MALSASSKKRLAQLAAEGDLAESARRAKLKAERIARAMAKKRDDNSLRGQDRRRWGDKDAARKNRRKAERELARKIQVEKDAILAKPLRDDLAPDMKAEVRERVRQGLRPLRGSSVWSGV